VPLTFEPYIEFKKLVPHAIGLTHTGDTILYANMIVKSA
jgi:D-ribose pyranase